MKKTFALAFSISAIFISSAFAKIELLPADERPTQWLQFDIGGSANRGIERNQTWGGCAYNFDWQPFGAFLGFQSNSRIFDLTLRTGYLPFTLYKKSGVWRFGADTSWHIQRTPSSYTENDILEELEARWISNKGLAFSARIGYSCRITSFDAIKNSRITDWNPVVYVDVDKVWPNGLELFASLGSYGLYRYPLFFCPQWTFGAAWNITQSVRVGAALDLSMTDFYASVAYFNQVVAKCNLRLMF